MGTLNAWRGWRRCLIAYWQSDGEKYRIYEAIKQFFALLNSLVEFLENYDEEAFGAADHGEEA